jgi:hypothetical protein
MQQISEFKRDIADSIYTQAKPLLEGNIYPMSFSLNGMYFVDMTNAVLSILTTLFTTYLNKNLSFSSQKQYQ